MSKHKKIEDVLHITKHKLLEFANANGSDSQIENMRSDLAAAQSALTSNATAIRNLENGYQDRCRLAWEDSEKSLRKGKFTDFVNKCVFPNNDSCFDRNQTGRKDRFQRRYSECMTKYNAYLREKAKKAGLEQDISNIEDQIELYQNLLNESVGNGLSLQQAEDLANAELAKLQAEQEAQRLLNEQIENAKSNESSPYTKYIIIGGFLVAAVAMFVIFKKK